MEQCVQPDLKRRKNGCLGGYLASKLAEIDPKRAVKCRQLGCRLASEVLDLSLKIPYILPHAQRQMSAILMSHCVSFY